MEGSEDERFPDEIIRRAGRYYRALEEDEHVEAYDELIGMVRNHDIRRVPRNGYPEMFSIHKGDDNINIQVPDFETTQEIYNQVMDYSEFADMIYEQMLSPAEVFATPHYEVYYDGESLYYREENPEVENTQVELMESDQDIPLKEIVEASWILQNSPSGEEGVEMMRRAMEHFAVDTESLGYFPFDVEEESGWEMYVDESRDFGFARHPEEDRQLFMNDFQLKDVLSKM